jgi:acyl-CoA reductase-like NAD-dependent aldehyde dehydrogenase
VIAKMIIGGERAPAIASLISAENGKSIREATVEASRCGDVIRTSAFEGAHLYGELLPLDAAPGTGLDKIGFTVRQPCGVVLAITPLTYPGLLAIHKIAPALAAGNAVVLKPAELTPLTALARADCVLEAVLPGAVPSVVTGHGGEIGDALVADPRIRKVSFTGSTAVGERISRTAGVKKLSLELGSSSPVVILPDANLELAPQLSPPAATPTPARSASPCSGSSFIPR